METANTPHHKRRKEKNASNHARKNHIFRSGPKSKHLGTRERYLERVAFHGAQKPLVQLLAQLAHRLNTDERKRGKGGVKRGTQ